MHFAAKHVAVSAKRAATVALLSSLCGFISNPAQAADDFYTFKSMLSAPNASWCIAVPGADYQAGKHVAIASCNGQPNQVFGYEAGGSKGGGGSLVEGLPDGGVMGPADCDTTGPIPSPVPTGFWPGIDGPGDGVEAVRSTSERQTTDSTTMASRHWALTSVGHCPASGSSMWTRATTISFFGSSMLPMGATWRPSIEFQ